MKLNKTPLRLVACASILLCAPVWLWAEYQGSQVLSALQKHLKERVVNPEKDKEPTFKIVPASDERQAAQGHFSHVSLECRPVEIKKKLTMDILRVQADDVVIDADKLIRDNDVVVKSTKHTSLLAEMTATQFTSFLAKGKHTKDMNIKVKFENEKLRVTGNWKLFLFSGPIDTVGRLVVAKNDEIHFKVESLKLNGIGAPRSLINKFEEKVNPVIDSKDLPLNPPINAVRFKGDTLVVTGERGK